LLPLSDLTTHDRPVRRVKLRILDPETSHDSGNLGGIENANKHPGSLQEVSKSDSK
jgi:hypothetical protein